MLEAAYHDVIRLQVSVADVFPMHVLSGLEELPHDATNEILAHKLLVERLGWRLGRGDCLKIFNLNLLFAIF